MNNTTEKKTAGRRVYLDFLRIIAIFMVLFNHTWARGFMLFTQAQGSPLYPVYLFNGIFIKIAVPVFLMISGALLLDKEEPYLVILKKRFLRFLAVLLGASLVNYLCFPPAEPSAADFFRTVYTRPMITAYWYLYAYLAFILMLPLLRKLAKSMSNQDYHWLIAMYAVIQLLSIAEWVFSKGEAAHYGHFDFFIKPEYVIYPLLGYYMEHRIKDEDYSCSKLMLAVGASIAAIGVSCVLTHSLCVYLGEWQEATCQRFFNTLIFIPAMTAFYAAKYLFIKHPPKAWLCKVITTIGSTTFGIYLLEEIVRYATNGVFEVLDVYIPRLAACWIWIFSACALGAAITWIIKKIPIVSKYI